LKPLSFIKPWTLLAGFLLLTAIVACNKDPFTVGFNLLPPTDTIGITTTDTVTVQAYSMLVDSVRSDETVNNLLGSLMDPVFGKTSASFYAQFRLPIEGIDFGASPVMDSLVLLLYYEGYYGDTTTMQHVKVYELSQDLYYDSSYYSNQTANHYGTLLADQDYRPRPTDSVTIWGKKTAPHLRINLSKNTNYLGNKLLFAPTGVLASNTEFIKFMKGLAIMSSPVEENGAFISYSTGTTASKMVLYFHNQTSGQGDSLHYDFIIDASAARFNNFNHYNYENASIDFQQQVLNHDTALGQESLYLQGMAGVKMKVRLPYIKSFAHGKPIAINNAQLFFDNADVSSSLAPPENLTMVMYDTAGGLNFVLDAGEGTNYYGGTYDSATSGYWFRLTRHIQNLIDNDTMVNRDLYILATNPLKTTLFTNRAVIHGTNPNVAQNGSARMRMKIIYTVLH